MPGIAAVIMLWKQHVLEISGHYGSFSIKSFAVGTKYKWYRQNLTILIPFVPMLIHATFSCQLIDYPT